MKKHPFAFLAAIFGILAFSASVVMPQEDIKAIMAKAFTQHTRPAAVFMHDAHNEKAGVDFDCGACHHGKDAQGKKDVEDITTDTPCAGCHTVDANSGTPLMRAYHQQCINCHKEKKLGPTHCGGCHKR
jgi:hypothetical protein